MYQLFKEALLHLGAQKDGIAAAVSILGLIGGGVALCLLWTRTVATTHQANAALKTAEAALHASQAAIKQADVATRRHENQTEADRERRLMDAFAKAMEQLDTSKYRSNSA
jgi:Tfp pilus assembly protein PilX